MITAKTLTFLTCLTTLLDKQHRMVIDYLKEENQILREQIHGKHNTKRIVLTDRQRKRLAAKAKPLGRKLLGETTELFRPATILGWYRSLIAKKYDGSANRKGGRTKVTQIKIDWILKMSKENPNWGAGKISNYMKYLNMEVGKSTVWRVMEDNGFNPSPEERNKGNWNSFIKSHFNVLAATDFFTVELLTPKGLVRCMVLFTKKFDEILEAGGVKALKTPKQSPNLNAYAERFVQTIKKECLNHLILTNEKQLKYACEEFLQHYHHERPHEGLGGKIISPLPQDEDGEIIQFERLGGLLKSYRRVKIAA